MKRSHKSALAILVTAAAGLTVWSAAAGRQALSQPVEVRSPALPSPAVSAAEATLPAVLATPERPARQGDAAVAADQIANLPPPSDLKISVRDTPAGRVLTLKRQGYLVAVRQGADRRVGLHQAAWTRVGDAVKLTWETTNATTLETTRGELTWSGDDTTVPVFAAPPPAVVAADSAPGHRCQGHADGAGGFVVVCRVDSSAAAASLENKDSREGVWSMAGDSTLVRFDLPMGAEGVNTKVLGYEKARKGVLVRVEASRAQGEAAATLVIASDGRMQPNPPRPRICCRLPMRDF